MPKSIRPMLVVAFAVVILAAGCGGPFHARFDPSGAALTTSAAERLARATDISALARVRATDAPALRDTVLRDLRTRGASGDRAATLLTAGFPERTLAVPVLVRVCPVDGRAAIVVVEAFGEAPGYLVHRRLWVFDAASGGILAAASFR
jgi:hypothetical protein